MTTLQLWLTAIYLCASLLSLILYGLDKAAAKRGTWRIRESSLHGLALLGGWPGALLAQRLFRHKTQKLKFRLLLWLMIVLNCSLVVMLSVSAQLL